MRFADPVPDARHVVYARIQADPLVTRAAELLDGATPTELRLARAVMNGVRTDPAIWRSMFPTLVGAAAPEATRLRAGAILDVSLRIADRGEQARQQYRGAVVEALTERLLHRRSDRVHRERRVLFDGLPAEIHPYDVTVEDPRRPEIYDCKWGARGIDEDVLHQLDDARHHAAEEGIEVLVALVVFDAERSCRARLASLRAPVSGTRLVILDGLGQLAAGPPILPADEFAPGHGSDDAVARS